MRHLIAAITMLTLTACGADSTTEQPTSIEQPTAIVVTPPLVYDCFTLTDDTITYNDGTVIEDYTDAQYWEALEATC